MARPLEGRIAAITGASSGIGAATALALSRAGAAVALGARRRERLDELAGLIESEGGRALAQELDVSDEAAARAFVERAHGELGGLSLLVNNAGLMLLGAVEGADTAAWRRMVDVNVLGVLWCTHAALPLLRAAGGGDIVNVSSVSGRRSDAGAAVYNGTKHFLSGFGEALRQEAIAADVRVISIEPGFVDTELQGHNIDPAVQRATERARDRIGKVLEAEDVAEAILHAVTRPAHVALNQVLMRPARQLP